MPRNRDNSNTATNTPQENSTNTTAEVEKKVESIVSHEGVLAAAAEINERIAAAGSAEEEAKPVERDGRLFSDPVEVEPGEPVREQYVDDEGRRWLTYIGTSHFIPKGDEREIAKAMLYAPIGFTVWFGTVTGWADGDEDKVNRFKDRQTGEEVERTSICLLGDFKAERSDADGVIEVLRSTRLYLPMNFARFVRTQLKLPKARETGYDLDLEVGVTRIKPIGQTIFSWAVRSFGADPGEARHRLIEARRAARLARRADRARLGAPRREAPVIEAVANPEGPSKSEVDRT